MNFDGKALVVNQDIETFYSDNGSAIVVPNVKQEFNYSTGQSNVVITDLVFNNTKTIGKAYSNLTADDFYNRAVGLSPFTVTVHVGPKEGKVPYTAQIYSEAKTKWKDTIFLPTKTFVKDARVKYEKICTSEARVQIYDTVSRYNHDDYTFITTKIHDIVASTNLFVMNQETAFIIDCVKVTNANSFPSVSATIVDKTEIVVPPPSKGYQDMFFVVQKNSFIELKLSDTILDVTGLPEGLEYSLNAIKGIIAKSGSYDIRIQYQESAQKLNIIVPYYERTL
jgi:hypothetical protein